MIAHSETLSRPLYTEPFRELDPARVPKPAGTRYQPRETPLVGMFDTSRPLATKTAGKARPGTSHAFLTPSQIDQAANNRRKKESAPFLTQPHSIASRCLAALRETPNEWTPTRDLVELSNAHRPEHCTTATLLNIYEALKRPRKLGLIESRKSKTVPNGSEWRIAK